MSLPAFDPDAIMRRVRAAAAKASEPAKVANPLKNDAGVSSLAGLAALPASDAGAGGEGKSSRLAELAASPVSHADLDALDLADAIEERAGLAADGVPAVYLDAWARLNCQKPFLVSDDEWRRALDDGGRFLDAWGCDAAEMGWTPGELFDVTAGLAWRLAGARVEAIGADRARLSDGRTIMRRA